MLWAFTTQVASSGSFTEIRRTCANPSALCVIAHGVGWIGYWAGVPIALFGVACVIIDARWPLLTGTNQRRKGVQIIQPGEAHARVACLTGLLFTTPIFALLISLFLPVERFLTGNTLIETLLFSVAISGPTGTLFGLAVAVGPMLWLLLSKGRRSRG